ncbi:hypothetical protein [Candidatus Hodarchaeum mangrovi]
MNSNIKNETTQKSAQNKKLIGFSISFILIFLSDILFVKYMPFWIFPLLIGIGIGIYLQFPLSGIFALLGAMLARFFTIIINILTSIGTLKTGDLFMAAIGDVLGIPLPFGSLLIIIMSIIFCGLFSLLGGLLGGSATRLSLYYIQNKKS